MKVKQGEGVIWLFFEDINVSTTTSMKRSRKLIIVMFVLEDIFKSNKMRRSPALPSYLKHVLIFAVRIFFFSFVMNCTLGDSSTSYLIGQVLES